MKTTLRIQRLIAWVTVFSFTCTQTVWALPQGGISILVSQETPQFLRIEVPKHLASIEEVYEAPPQSDPRMILHIQDLHGNFEAQTKIKDLLNYLHKTYDFNLLFVEGANAKLNPDYIQVFPDEERNQQFAELLAEEGELSGAELFVIENPDKVDAIGIERSELYRKNYEAFKKVHKAKEKTDVFLTRFEGQMETLSSRFFSRDMRRLLKEWQKFQDGHRDFLPYVKRLAEESKRFLGLDLESLFAQVQWPQLSRLLVVQAMEAELDLKQAEKEKELLIQFLRKKKVSRAIIEGLGQLGDREITMMSLQADRSELKNLPRYLLERLIEEAGPKGFFFHDYPHFSLHAGYLILQSEIDAKSLFNEIDRVFKKTLDELAVSEREKNLLELYRDEDLLRKILRLELTRSEWTQASYRKEWIEPKVMLERIQKIGENESRKTLKLSKGFEDVYETALRFYDFARERDKVFYERIEESMAESSSKKAVLVTGGFHTEGILDILREEKINYGVLTPRVRGEITHGKYVDIMLENRSTMFDVTTLAAHAKILDIVDLRELGLVDKVSEVKKFLSIFAKLAKSPDLESLVNDFNAFNRLGYASNRKVELVLGPEKDRVYIKVDNQYLTAKIDEAGIETISTDGFLTIPMGEFKDNEPHQRFGLAERVEVTTSAPLALRSESRQGQNTELESELELFRARVEEIGVQVKRLIPILKIEEPNDEKIMKVMKADRVLVNEESLSEYIAELHASFTKSRTRHNRFTTIFKRFEEQAEKIMLGDRKGFDEDLQDINITIIERAVNDFRNHEAQFRYAILLLAEHISPEIADMTQSGVRSESRTNKEEKQEIEQLRKRVARHIQNLQAFNLEEEDRAWLEGAKQLLPKLDGDLPASFLLENLRLYDTNLNRIHQMAKLRRSSLQSQTKGEPRILKFPDPDDPKTRSESRVYEQTLKDLAGAGITVEDIESRAQAYASGEANFADVELTKEQVILRLMKEEGYDLTETGDVSQRLRIAREAAEYFLAPVAIEMPRVISVGDQILEVEMTDGNPLIAFAFDPASFRHRYRILHNPLDSALPLIPHHKVTGMVLPTINPSNTLKGDRDALYYSLTLVDTNNIKIESSLPIRVAGKLTRNATIVFNAATEETLVPPDTLIPADAASQGAQPTPVVAQGQVPFIEYDALRLGENAYVTIHQIENLASNNFLISSFAGEVPGPSIRRTLLPQPDGMLEAVIRVGRNPFAADDSTSNDLVLSEMGQVSTHHVEIRIMRFQDGRIGIYWQDNQSTNGTYQQNSDGRFPDWIHPEDRHQRTTYGYLQQRSESRKAPDRIQAVLKLNVEGVERDVYIREGGILSVDLGMAPMPSKVDALRDAILSSGMVPSEAVYIGNQNKNDRDRDGQVARILDLRVKAVDAKQAEVFDGRLPENVEAIGAGIEATEAYLRGLLEMTDNEFEALNIGFIGLDIDGTVLGNKTVSQDGKPKVVKESFANGDRLELAELIVALEKKHNTRFGFFSDNDSKLTRERVGNHFEKLQAEAAIETSQSILFYTSGMATSSVLKFQAGEWKIQVDHQYSNLFRMPVEFVKAITDIIGWIEENPETGVIRAAGPLGEQGLLWKYYAEKLTRLNDARKHIFRDEVQNFYGNFTPGTTEHGNIPLPTVQVRDRFEDGTAAQVAILPVLSRAMNESDQLDIEGDDIRSNFVWDLIDALAFQYGSTKAPVLVEQNRRRLFDYAKAKAALLDTIDIMDRIDRAGYPEEDDLSLDEVDREARELEIEQLMDEIDQEEARGAPEFQPDKKALEVLDKERQRIQLQLAFEPMTPMLDVLEELLDDPATFRGRRFVSYEAPIIISSSVILENQVHEENLQRIHRLISEKIPQNAMRVIRAADVKQVLREIEHFQSEVTKAKESANTFYQYREDVIANRDDENLDESLLDDNKGIKVLDAKSVDAAIQAAPAEGYDWVLVPYSLPVGETQKLFDEIKSDGVMIIAYPQHAKDGLFPEDLSEFIDRQASSDKKLQRFIDVGYTVIKRSETRKTARAPRGGELVTMMERYPALRVGVPDYNAVDQTLAIPMQVTRFLGNIVETPSAQAAVTELSTLASYLEQGAQSDHVVAMRERAGAYNVELTNNIVAGITVITSAVPGAAEVLDTFNALQLQTGQHVGYVVSVNALELPQARSEIRNILGQAEERGLEDRFFMVAVDANPRNKLKAADRMSNTTLYSGMHQMNPGLSIGQNSVSVYDGEQISLIGQRTISGTSLASRILQVDRLGPRTVVAMRLSQLDGDWALLNGTLNLDVILPSRSGLDVNGEALGEFARMWIAITAQELIEAAA